MLFILCEKLLVLKIFTFLSRLFWLEENDLMRAKLDFKIYDVKDWETNI